MLALPALAQAKLPRIFTDSMVLQQQQPIAVWGWAKAGEAVTVTLADATRETKADERGRWRVDLPAMSADGRSHELVVRAANEIRLRDVVLGEVWLCAGQSNMNRESQVRDEDHDIRMFWIDASVVPQRDDLGEQVAGWAHATPEAVAAAKPTMRRGKSTKRNGFAEVGYVFGRRLQSELKVPVGLIKCAFGGSQVRAWMPDPELPERVPFGTAAEGKYLGHRPGLMYQSMVHGIVPFSMRGVLWYQGENDGRSKTYADELANWIKTWRGLWGRPEMPFHLVQIAPTTYAGGRMQFIWEAQSKVMQEVPHVGLAVSNDIYLHGNAPAAEVIGEDGRLHAKMRPSNPHPPNKHVVAERLAEIALQETYGKQRGVLYGPMLQSAQIADDKVLVTMQHVGAGLKTRDGADPDWFELSDGTVEKGRLVFHRAKARIVDARRIEVRSAAIASPKFVRFAWNCTAIHNLVNSAGLPAVSFRTDTADK